jgi:hemoglobin
MGAKATANGIDIANSVENATAGPIRHPCPLSDIAGTPTAGPGAAMTETDHPPSMYERIGGAPAIDRLVEAFYREMDTRPEARAIRAMHAPDLGPTKITLKRHLAEWTGGPALYSAEKGHPRLRQRHMGFAIGNSERDAWLACMRAALAEAIADPACRADLDVALTRLADWMRNSEHQPHRGNGS